MQEVKEDRPTPGSIGGGARSTNGHGSEQPSPYFTPLPDDRAIACAIRELVREGVDREDFFIESFDTVRLAFSWLDAQHTIKGRGPLAPLKHIIESWGGRYISATAVKVAARLHPHTAGSYPAFNISRRLTWPDPRRLDAIPEAGIHRESYSAQRHAGEYTRREVLGC